jgi:tryptophan halogenase
VQDKRIRKVVIAGGGTAGWMAAAALSKQLSHCLDITLVESDLIGTIGVGEATIPPLIAFHRLLEIDEQEFMRATYATFKLGIQFENWNRRGDKYIHPFGMIGKDTWAGGFQHFWLRGLRKGITDPCGAYCFEWQAAQAERFGLTENPRLNYAYHLDATRYAKFLRKKSEANGVKRVEGKISEVTVDPSSGNIASLKLDSGKIIEGDLFVDCTGFRGLLIEETLHTGYEDWTRWLPCDSAVAVQTESTGEMAPYTRSISHDAGWQWRIPLQHRVGNGLVFCSRYIQDDAAKQLLMSNIEGKTLIEPRVIKFVTGRRRLGWNKNCVALGLASGFIEPLESTSIHMIMSCVLRMMRLLSTGVMSPAAVNEYNQQTNLEFERIRDFIVLHYHLNNRDEPFWRECREMQIPETLAHRIDLFKETGQVFKTEDELFRIDSWIMVMLGQGIMPQSYHLVADIMNDEQLHTRLNGFRMSLEKMIAQLPTHKEFVKQYCGVTLEEA